MLKNLSHLDLGFFIASKLIPNNKLSILFTILE